MSITEMVFRPGLALDDLVTAVDDVQQQMYQAGETVFTEGDTDDRLYVVVDGKVALGCHCEDGRQCVFAVVGRSEMFGEESALDHGPRTSCAVTLTQVEVICIPRQVLRSWLAADPGMTDQIFRVMARRIRRSHNRITDVAYADVPSRVAKNLLGLAQQFGVQRDGDIVVTTDLTQEQFAQLVGTTRESVNKALCEFSERGWIQTDGTTIVIHDSAPLSGRVHGVRNGRPPCTSI
ncbi:Crp/Fnr family transcriptional regulator [Mycolicibacterium murale]|uniref:Crp/Fnr family transcriptional regulator n=1 Tax=Mycolicibacterium murale TaxID=182220 RepID=A0A7I9WS85_9MYCO|nr:Crp/Fnr family transcriptional regulator [Mycolicibacterium murale]MCV7186002.1 Crp/Fnr family transcriptional regulator [Mycolicibacterium murale]GFG60230.1 Crp/Fnr family transcriptional regulator [Mycolicibacterium murale]